MSKKMKNIAQSEVLTLREQISYQEGKVSSSSSSVFSVVDILHKILLGEYCYIFYYYSTSKKKHTMLK